MTNFTQSLEKILKKSETLLSQSLALRSKCFDGIQRSRALKQSSSVLLHNIRNQPWYKHNLVRLHQESLLATELNLQKTQILLLKIQEYSTLLLFNPAAIDFKQVNQFEIEIGRLIENTNQILKRYKFLLKEDDFRAYCTDNKCIESVNYILIDLGKMHDLVKEIRDRYDPDYRAIIKIRELTRKISSII